jgi:hypothetical protein
MGSSLDLVKRKHLISRDVPARNHVGHQKDPIGRNGDFDCDVGGIRGRSQPHHDAPQRDFGAGLAGHAGALDTQLGLHTETH